MREPTSRLVPLRPSVAGVGMYALSVVLAVGMPAFGAWVSWAGWTQYGPPESFISTLIGLVFASIGLAGWDALLNGGSRAVVVSGDAGGLVLARPDLTVRVPWASLRGVGVGAKGGPLFSRGAALELFGDPAALDEAASLGWWASESPPRPGLDDKRLRIVSAFPRQLRAARQLCETYAPSLWLGRYRRDAAPPGQ